MSKPRRAIGKVVGWFRWATSGPRVVVLLLLAFVPSFLKAVFQDWVVDKFRAILASLFGKDFVVTHLLPLANAHPVATTVIVLLALPSAAVAGLLLYAAYKDQAPPPQEIPRVATTAKRKSMAGVVVRPEIIARRIGPDDHPVHGFHRGRYRSPGQEGGTFAVLNVANDVSPGQRGGTLRGVVVTVELRDSNGKPLLAKPLQAPWLFDRKREPGGEAYVPCISTLDTFFLKNLESHPVGIAVRYPTLADDECFALSRRSREWHDWLDPELKLNGKEIQVRVTVGSALGTSQWTLKLENLGVDGGLSWSGSPDSTRRRSA